MEYRFPAAIGKHSIPGPCASMGADGLRSWQEAILSCFVLATMKPLGDSHAHHQIRT